MRNRKKKSGATRLAMSGAHSVNSVDLCPFLSLDKILNPIKLIVKVIIRKSIFFVILYLKG